MSNSALAILTVLSPNCTLRTHAIDTITIHHTAAVGVSAREIGNIFASPSRRASSNYGIGVNGEIGMYVPENYRAWTSSNSANDNRAITIEVANESGEPDWRISKESYLSLILLCTDICKRNGIKALLWKATRCCPAITSGRVTGYSHSISPAVFARSLVGKHPCSNNVCCRGGYPRPRLYGAQRIARFFY